MKLDSMDFKPIKSKVGKENFLDDGRTAKKKRSEYWDSKPRIIDSESVNTLGKSVLDPYVVEIFPFVF